MEGKIKNSFHIRVYDLEIAKSIEELMKTGDFDTANELLGKAVAIGIEKIYLEYGKHKRLTKLESPEIPEGKRLDKIEVKLEKQRIMQEDMFILMNSIEAIVASILNVQRAEVNGEAVSGELIDSGYLSKLPPAYLEIKDNLVARFNRKLAKEQKPE